MSRSWSDYGLHDRARALLEKERVIAGLRQEVVLRFVTPLKDGDAIPDLGNFEAYTKTVSDWVPFHDPGYEAEETSRQEVWYGEEQVYHKLTFRDGRVWETYEQACEWSSGPHTYLALRDFVTKEPIKESLWTDEEIRECL